MALKLYITEAKHLGGLNIHLKFNDGITQDINFESLFKNHPHPQYNKYREEKNFKKFTIENGNIVWGKDWDLIFPIDKLHSGILE